MIRCVTFDLDDTLWDINPVIRRAEKVFYRWLEDCFPAVVQRYLPAELVEHRKRFMARMPELRHDLTAFRKSWLAEIARNTGYGGELVKQGFDVYWQARNEVELFQGVSDALRMLSTRYRLGAVTNGNADVHTIGIGHFFDFVVTSAEAGQAKPSPVIFEAALDEAGVSAAEVVHVGDDPVRDIAGAQQVGMRTVWVNVADVDWPGGPVPDAIVSDLPALPAAIASLHPL